MVSTKRIKIILFLVVVLLYNKSISNSFAVWQGFEHQWKYNHRLNRIGDYIAQSNTPTDQKKYFSSVHTGATGLGKDSAVFKSYFSTIKTDLIDYSPGVETFTIQGKQAKYYEFTRIVFVPITNINHQKNVTAILNGFDIVSNSGADKIQMLNLEVTDVEQCQKPDTLRFKIKIALVFNCTSFECNRLNKKIDYTITLRYLLLGAKPQNIHASIIPYHYKLNWTKNEFLSPTKYQKTIPTQNQFDGGFLAYKHINIILNTDHWFVSFANAITNTTYNKAQKNIVYNTTSYFKQWEKGMQKTSTQSKFSSAKAGWGIITGSLVLIELKQAQINNYVQDGCIFWNGKNKRPNTNECVNLNQIEII
ncbi:MAG: hypothetical protein IPK18_05940 [Sphingobacteriales bacterium]|jgi:hypothetical protein|nr:MAG: hypothetical protein IPK18_05940 [Sphingobacteriales bacterium]